MKDSPVSRNDIAQTELNNESLTIKVAFLDVGQGDTMVISSPNTDEAIVVDCIDAESVLDYLEQEKVTHFRGIVITHLHDDHYNQVPSLLYRYHVVPGMGACEKLAFVKIMNKANFEKLSQDNDGHQQQAPGQTLLNPLKQRKNVLQNMLDWCYRDKNNRYIDPSVQSGVDLLPLTFKGTLIRKIQVMHPNSVDLFKLETKGLNNTSVVLRVVGSSSSALLTGDLEPEGWNILRENNPDLRCDVLKFPHHGGAWDEPNTKALLDTLQPSIVVISVGMSGEQYNHPNEEVFRVLSSPTYSHIRVLCTQVTNKCCQTVLNQKKPVIEQLSQEANNKNYKLIGSKRGCPCAGTIIIELGKKARIMQPSIAFHHDRIIQSHFHDHKCLIDSR